MSADEALPWLFLVMAAGAFLLGAYLLVTNRQAKAASGESNEVTFLGVTIKSSTSGTTLILLAVVAVVLIISFGLDSEGSGSTADEEPDPEPEPAGEIHLLSLDDLEDQAGDIASWDARGDLTKQPALSCQVSFLSVLTPKEEVMSREYSGTTAAGMPAEVRTTVSVWSGVEEARQRYDLIKSWVRRCDDQHERASHSFAGAEAGEEHDEDGDFGPTYWRYYRAPAPEDCTGCDWVEFQGVGRLDDKVVLVSVGWATTSDEDPEDVSPFPQLIDQALDLADS